MAYWVHAMTGGSDVWRCAQRTACNLRQFLHPWAHLVRRENRSSDVVGGQWELAILMLACWAACSQDAGSSVVFKNGEALFTCPMCDHLVPYAAHEDGSGVLQCPSAVCTATEPPFPTLQLIPKSVFDTACNAARRLAGGIRGYPMFLGMNTRLQLPVLHCTGNLSKMVILFTLACLPAEVCALAKRNILAITSKGKVESLYLREFREMVASVVACPSVLSEDLDPVFLIIMQLVQLINAGWRSSLAETDGKDRAASAATTRLAASILGPLFNQVKPLDPDTKDSKVVNLYLHAPIAHLHHQVGDHRAPVAYVSDDNMEGHIRGVGRFIHNNGGNASQAALFSDLVGLNAATINFSTPRSHPSSLIYTKFIRVCACWATLGKDGPADYAALHTIAKDEAELEVIDDGSSQCLAVQLPLHGRADVNGARRQHADGKPLLGKKEALRRGLRRAQHTIVACFCGKFSPRSPLMEVSHQRQAAAEAAAAAAAALDAIATAAAPRAAVSRSAAVGEARAPSRTAPVLSASDGPCHSQDESEGGTATDGGMASSAEDRLIDGDHGGGSRRRKSKSHTAAGITSAVAVAAPPLSLLQRIFDDPAMYATVYDEASAEPRAPMTSDIVACARKHIFIMEQFLLRVTTRQFMEWSMNATVDRKDIVVAAQRVLSRLLSVRNALLPVEALMAIA